MSELKKCPFCGGEADIFEASEDSFCTLCTDCGVETPYQISAEEAIAAWNRRTQPENICPLLSDAEVKQPCIEGPCQAYWPENEPLTLKELRQMDGEPVYVVTLDNPLENQPYWAIAGINSNDSRYQNGVALYNRVQDDWGAFDLYGDTWLAYRRKPERSEE